MDSLKISGFAGRATGYEAPSAVGVMTARGSRVNTDWNKNRHFFQTSS
jgi:phage/plasmid primase-like uncharacterized protein